MREAGATAVQEVAFALANGLAYLRKRCATRSTGSGARRAFPSFLPRTMIFFEEVAKFRAARRLWARLLREQFGMGDPLPALRFHAQTAGSTLTAQQAENNLARTALQALAAHSWRSPVAARQQLR